MIDSTRLGLLLRVLTRTDNGLAAHDVTPQVPRLPAITPVGRETHALVPPTLLARGSSDAPARSEDESNARPPADTDARQARDAPLRQAAQQTGEAPARQTAASARQSLSGNDAAHDRTPAGDRQTSASAYPAREGRSIALTLSDTAQLLAAVLRDVETPATASQRLVAQATARATAADTAQPGSPTTPHVAGESTDEGATRVMRARPLVPLPPDVVAARERFAAALQQAVEYSGLFYEAHVAQWAQGDRSTARLAREPQAHWPQGEEADALIALGGAGSGADAPAPVLRQQLDMLDTSRFVWTGELWPGQRGSLSIEEDPERAEDSGPGWTGPRSWRSRIRLELPRLGNVEASLVLRGTGVALTLHCAQATSARRLAAATPTLRVAIMQRGLDVNQLVIGDDAAT